MASQPKKVTILDARVPRGAPLADLLMAASEGELKLYAVTKGWQAANGETLEGWAKLDVADILNSLNCDHIMVNRVHQAGRTYKLNEPHKVMMGAVYMELAAPASDAKAQPKPAPQPDTGDDFIDTREAARLLNCAPNTLEKWRSQGSEGPPFHKISSRTIRYKRSEVLAWREKSST